MLGSYVPAVLTSWQFQKVLVCHVLYLQKIFIEEKKNMKCENAHVLRLQYELKSQAESQPARTLSVFSNMLIQQKAVNVGGH